MGYGGGGGGGGGSGGSGGGGGGAAGYGDAGAGGSGAGGGSGYRRVGDDRTAPGLKVNNITNRTEDGGPEVDGIVEVNTTAHFIPPSGTTAERGSRGRGMWGGGRSPGDTNIIDFITIATTGNATDFGDLSVARRATGGASSSTRGIWAGGLNSTVIDYVTIPSTGNAFDFGDLTVERFYPAGASDNTRALFAGGYDPGSPAFFYKTIDYVTIASKGNASVFGLLYNGTQGATGSSGGTEDRNKGGKTDIGSCASPTRAIFAGGNEGYNYPTTAVAQNSIDYVTIQTLGNAFDFGDLLDGRTGIAGCSSTTRGVFGGGHTGPTLSPLSVTNVIQYITIASLGNAVDFGDLTQARERFSGTSNTIRGVFGGGTTPDNSDVIDFVTIASTGNAADFGNLTDARRETGACSDSHGGLG